MHLMVLNSEQGGSPTLSDWIGKSTSGFPFIFDSAILGGEIFFKFQIVGTAKKPQVLFWSCHPPVYGIKRDKS